ncbi:hypothetical protein DMUE_6233 [Dictyocoela muelleri]|nr:hypothetical protein DMUE_6233 [Dictyocoela muelleri]
MIIRIEHQCETCESLMKICSYEQNESIRLCYRCVKRGCQKRKSVYRTNIGLDKFITAIYLLMSNSSYWQLRIWLGISDPSINIIKNKLRTAYGRYIDENPIFLGGLGVSLQVDETVLSRRGKITNPTSCSDDYADTIWILGVVEPNNAKNFYLKRLENRKAITITESLEGIVRVGSILCSDGYPSYPTVAVNLHLHHRVVNHSTGFVNDEGYHTNNIESFWSHLKSTMIKENGVKRENIDNWLKEYTFKRRYLVNSTKAEFEILFIQILRILFEN